MSDSEDEDEEEVNTEDDRIGHTSWCTCNECQPMMKSEESFCCKEDRNVQVKQAQNSWKYHRNQDYQRASPRRSGSGLSA